MRSACYVDTSALAKWYLPEAGAAAFERFMNAPGERRLSRLSLVELRCLLARRRRAGDFDAAYERDAYASFERHAAAGIFSIRPVADGCYGSAVDLIERLAPLPLRTLDAIHLAAAIGMGADGMATADKVMADAAAALGLEVAFFGGA